MALSILVITAVEAEKEAVERGARGDDRFRVVAGGVGPASAAASAAFALAERKADLVVSAGIAGGFPGVAPVGSVVVASESVAADLGAETPEGFATVEALGFGSNRIAADAQWGAKLTEALASSGRAVCLGPVLTLSTATGTADTAAGLASRVPGAAAEGMEGYGVAEAARRLGVPFLEIRGISNAVGPRDRAAWKIGDALSALETAILRLKEILPS